MARDNRLERSLARSIGLLSLALGALQLLVPARFNALIGVGRREADGAKRPRGAITRAIGLRELTAAAGLLTRRRPAAFGWSRVAGDAMDMALLARAATLGDSRRGRIALAMAGVAGIALVDVVASSLLSAASSAPREERLGNRRAFRRSVTVLRSPQDAAIAWQEHWPATVVAAEEGRAYAFESQDGVLGPITGTVTFTPAPGDRGTEIRMEAEYEPPLGAVGVALSRLSPDDPARRADDQLRRLKEVIETGIEVESDATRGGHRVKQRAAQPEGSR